VKMCAMKRKRIPRENTVSSKEKRKMGKGGG
jgi:hypothetical protein